MIGVPTVAKLVRKFAKVADQLDNHAQYNRERAASHTEVIGYHRAKVQLHDQEAQNAERIAAKVRELIA